MRGRQRRLTWRFAAFYQGLSARLWSQDTGQQISYTPTRSGMATVPPSPTSKSDGPKAIKRPQEASLARGVSSLECTVRVCTMTDGAIGLLCIFDGPLARQLKPRTTASATCRRVL